MTAWAVARSDTASVEPCDGRRAAHVQRGCWVAPAGWAGQGWQRAQQPNCRGWGGSPGCRFPSEQHSQPCPPPRQKVGRPDAPRCAACRERRQAAGLRQTLQPALPPLRRPTACRLQRSRGWLQRAACPALQAGPQLQPLQPLPCALPLPPDSGAAEEPAGGSLPPPPALAGPAAPAATAAPVPPPLPAGPGVALPQPQGP